MDSARARLCDDRGRWATAAQELARRKEQAEDAELAAADFNRLALSGVAPT